MVLTPQVWSNFITKQRLWELIHGVWSCFLFPWCWYQNYLVLCRLSDNNQSMNIDKFKLSIVRILVRNQIDALPCSSKEVRYKLVHIYMNGTARHVYVYCGLFYNKNGMWYKCKYTEWNMSIYSFIYHSVQGIGQYWFSLDHYT